MWTTGHTMGHTVTYYSFHNEMFSMLCFDFVWLCFILMGSLQGWRGGEGEMSGTGVHDVKFTENQPNVKEKWSHIGLWASLWYIFMTDGGCGKLQLAHYGCCLPWAGGTGSYKKGREQEVESKPLRSILL